MRLSLFNVGKWDDSWDVSILDIETYYWNGSLLSISKWNGRYQFDLFWLRQLMYKLFDK